MELPESFRGENVVFKIKNKRWLKTVKHCQGAFHCTMSTFTFDTLIHFDDNTDTYLLPECLLPECGSSTFT